MQSLLSDHGGAARRWRRDTPSAIPAGCTYAPESSAPSACGCCASSDVEATFYGLRNEKRSEEHTSELQSLMRISYAVFCVKKNKNSTTTTKLTTLMQ